MTARTAGQLIGSRVGRRRSHPSCPSGTAPRWRSRRPRVSACAERRRRPAPRGRRASPRPPAAPRGRRTRTRSPLEVVSAAWTPSRSTSSATVRSSAGAPRSTSASRPCHSSAASSSGRPKACRWPWCSTAMRSASRPASPRKWVHSTTVRPCSVASEPIRSMTSRVAAGSRPGGRLVEEQHLGVVQQGPGQRDPLALARSRSPALVVGPVGHAERARAARRRGSAPSPTAQPRIWAVKVRFSRAVSRSSRPAFSVSTPVRRRTSSPSATGSRPSTRAPPAIGVEHAVEQADGRRLARAVGPEQGQHLPRLRARGSGRRARRSRRSCGSGRGPRWPRSRATV